MVACWRFLCKLFARFTPETIDEADQRHFGIAKGLESFLAGMMHCDPIDGLVIPELLSEIPDPALAFIQRELQVLRNAVAVILELAT